MSEELSIIRSLRNAAENAAAGRQYDAVDVAISEFLWGRLFLEINPWGEDTAANGSICIQSERGVVRYWKDKRRALLGWGSRSTPSGDTRGGRKRAPLRTGASMLTIPVCSTPSASPSSSPSSRR